VPHVLLFVLAARGRQPDRGFADSGKCPLRWTNGGDGCEGSGYLTQIEFAMSLRVSLARGGNGAELEHQPH
jgi:hypothetical protein